MKTIGLLGGMSWQSSREYYRLVNEAVQRRLGGLHSAKVLLASVDFAEVETLQRENRWREAGQHLAKHARQLEAGGAQLLVLCTNTMHRVADAIAAAVQIPMLHIADATATAIQAAQLRKVGLLGTAYTMEQDFYVGRLKREHGLGVLVPEAEERREIHRIIYEELCQGVVRETSRAAYLRAIETLIARGAQGVVLGCTEIGLLVKAEHVRVPLFDTTEIHALEAVERALDG